MGENLGSSRQLGKIIWSEFITHFRKN